MGDDMELTREQAIAETRKEWNYISDEIEKVKDLCDIHDLKIEYLKRNGFNGVLGGCFLCEYSEKIGGCSACPLRPETKNPHCLGGIFWDCVDAKTWQEQAALARRIANLPERIEVE